MSLNWWDGKTDARAQAQAGEEVWKLTHHYAYAVSNLGRVMSRVTGTWKEIKGSKMSSGYTSYGINEKSWLIHRLVVTAFDGPAPTEEHSDVRHLDGSKTNNSLPNLAWGTRSENMKDVFVHRQTTQNEPRRVIVSPEAQKRAWYGGDTLDTPLVQRTLQLVNQKKLRLEDAATLLGTTVASLPACFRNTGIEKLTGNHRAVFQADFIRNEVKAGRSRAEINKMSIEDIGKPLTAQDYYYFKTSLGLECEYSPPPLMQGEKHGMAKLSEGDILSVFRRIEDGELTDMKAVQAALGLSKTPSYHILSGRNWSHLHRSDKLKQQVAKMQRDVLAPETQQAIIKDLMAGMNRNDVKAKYDLSDSKIAFYVTKVNKMKTAT